MALTAAHCILREEWDNGDFPDWFSVKLADGETYGIKEIRANECWDLDKGAPHSSDIAFLILDRPIENAVAGKHYVKTWDAASMGDVAG